ncbi:hypothetical protein [Vibrio phage vB_VmeM-Yong XC32]|nr:hypothetical protein [Vibrio phage vB_VmeM-Yong XC32]
MQQTKLLYGAGRRFKETQVAWTEHVGGKVKKIRCPYYTSWAGILRRAKIAKVEVRPDFAQFENFKKHVEQQEKAFGDQPTTIVMMSEILNLDYVSLDNIVVLHRHHRNFFPRIRYDRTLPLWTSHYVAGGYQAQVKYMPSEENKRPRKKFCQIMADALDAHVAAAQAKVNNAQWLSDFYSDHLWHAKMAFHRFMIHLEEHIHSHRRYEPQWGKHAK